MSVLVPVHVPVRYGRRAMCQRTLFTNLMRHGDLGRSARSVRNRPITIFVPELSEHLTRKSADNALKATSRLTIIESAACLAT